MSRTFAGVDIPATSSLVRPIIRSPSRRTDASAVPPTAISMPNRESVS